MALDPSVPFRAIAGGTQQPDMMRRYGNALAIKQAVDKERASEARRNALAGAVNPDGSIDYGRARGALATSGDFDGAMAVDKHLGGQAKAKADLKLAELKLVGVKVDTGLKLINGVRDEASYQSFLAKANQYGLDVSDAPPNYDPNWVDKERREGLSIKDELSLALQERGVDIQADNLAERRSMNAWRKQNPDRMSVVVDPNTGAVSVASGPGVQSPAAPPSGRGSPVFRKEYEKGEAGNYAKYRQRLRDEANAASAIAFRVNQFRALNKNVRTGSWAAAEKEAKKLAKALGLNPEDYGFKDNVASAEGLTQLTTGFVLDAAEKMKGAFTEMEWARLAESAPGLGQTPEGNAMMLDTLEAAARRTQEINKLATAYQKEFGYLDSGFDEKLDQWRADNPMWSADMEADVDRLMGGAGTILAPAQSASQDQGPPVVTNRNDFMNLPSGAEFYDPQGNLRVKQ